MVFPPWIGSVAGSPRGRDGRASSTATVATSRRPVRPRLRRCWCRWWCASRRLRCCSPGAPIICTIIPGQIGFPGGRLEADDASPVHAALRETEEEIGLARSHVELDRRAARLSHRYRLPRDPGGRAGASAFRSHAGCLRGRRGLRGAAGPLPRSAQPPGAQHPARGKDAALPRHALARLFHLGGDRRDPDVARTACSTRKPERSRCRRRHACRERLPL